MKKIKVIAQSIGLTMLLHSVAAAATIYVDNQLADDCLGTYSIANRDNSGSDGNAYDTIQEAADIVESGDTVMIRNGVYNLDGISPVKVLYKNGTAGAKIIIRNYGEEEVIIDATNVLGISGVKYGIYVAYSEYIVSQGLIVRNSSGSGIRVFRSDHVEILNCTIHSNGVKGIYYRGSSYAVVDNCEVYGNGGVGISIHGTDGRSDYPVIADNLVYNQNIDRPEGADGISFGGSVNYGLIKNNIIFHSWDDGIDSCCGTMYTTIEDNIVFNNGDGPDGDGDGNGIKVSTGNSFGDGGGHTVRYNIAFSNETCGFDQCKEPDNPQNWFYNNIAYNNTGHGINAESDADYLHEAAVVDNCILANNGNLDMKDRFSRSLNASDYNLWTTDWTDQDSHSSVREGPHSILADPQFNNPDLVIDTNFQSGWTLSQKTEHIRSQVREKFSLQSGSLAIDNGTIITGYHCPYADDDPVNPMDPQVPGRRWLGDAPDIGAFEYGLDPYMVDPDPEPPIKPEEIPTKTEMQCYNNVFNPSKGEEAVIHVELNKQAHVKVIIYDHKGRKIKNIVNEEKQPGFYSMPWNGRDDGGCAVGSKENVPVAA